MTFVNGDPTRHEATIYCSVLSSMAAKLLFCLAIITRFICGLIFRYQLQMGTEVMVGLQHWMFKV